MVDRKEIKQKNAKPSARVSSLSPEKENELNFFIDTPLRLADKFMRKLFEDDSCYFNARYAYVAPEDAKRLLLYGAARHVFSACISLMNDKEAIEGPPEKEMDTMQRVVIESIIDNQNARTRKLIELLVNLINFSEFNKDESYCIYLSAENLDIFLGKQSDLKEFYDCKSRNVDNSINTFFQRIQSDLDNLGIDSIWFLKSKLNKKKQPSVFTSVRKRYKIALQKSTDEERIVLGISYQQSYSRFSLSVHPSLGSNPLEINFENIERNIVFISWLCFHIMNRLNKLAGYEDEESIEAMLKDKSIAPKIIERYKKRFEIGDIVLANSRLAEVLEFKESSYGYTSYKVKFLKRPPLPEIKEDWLQSSNIIMVFTISKVRDFFIESRDYFPYQSIKDTFEEILKEPDKVLLDYVKKVLIKLEEENLLIRFFRKIRTTHGCQEKEVAKIKRTPGGGTNAGSAQAG